MSRTSTKSLKLVGQDLHEGIVAYQREHNEVSYGQALQIVAAKAKNRDLVERYALRSNSQLVEVFGGV